MSRNPSKLIEVHNSTSNWDQPSWWAKMGNLLLVNMMLVPLAVSSQFVASSLTLTDRSPDAGWHCHALNCYIRISYYRCQCSILLLTGKSKSPGRWTLVSLVLLVIPRGFFLAFSDPGCRPSICSVARLLAVSVAGFSPFLWSSFSMSSTSTGSLTSWNICFNSASTSILDLGSFGYAIMSLMTDSKNMSPEDFRACRSSSTDGYVPSTSDAGRPSGKLVISESSPSFPSTPCVRLHE